MAEIVESPKEAMLQHLDDLTDSYRKQKNLTQSERICNLSISEINCYLDAYQLQRQYLEKFKND